ncbi:hypothetical protein OYC64_014752 [Pagothenia borchgrevinki]|uniref:Uncharacterized protein n=1 Tax=Pagothenia borchgrevinki TaxID=8213 RepID=A0ABD2H1V5_PAGBO
MGGARGVSAARDEKLVPDIYLTIPGSSDAPDVCTADSLRNIICLCSGKTENQTETGRPGSINHSPGNQDRTNVPTP